MSDFYDMRLADGLIHSARRFELTINMDKFRLMPRKWMEQLVVCLMDRVELREKFRTHYYVKDAADRIRELEIELGALLRQVAHERPIRN
jgi:hypothetical protein